MVVDEFVVWIGDPECADSSRRLGWKKRARPCDETEVFLQGIVLLTTILEKEAMTQVIEGDVVFHSNVVGSMNSHTSRKTVMDSVIPHVNIFGRGVETHVEVNRVCTLYSLLSHGINLSIFDFHRREIAKE